MEAEVYTPREDTYLLLRTAQEKITPDDSVLEVGCGSGLVSEKLSEKASIVVATDINPEAVKKTKRRDIDAVQTDIYAAIDYRFNLVLFNPPYLPSSDTDLSDWTSVATESTNKGLDATKRFLENLETVLKPDGSAIIIASTKTGLNRVREQIQGRGFTAEEIGSEDLFFEKLAAFQIK